MTLVHIEAIMSMPCHCELEVDWSNLLSSILYVVFDPLCYVPRAFVMSIYREKELYKAPVMHRCECLYVC